MQNYIQYIVIILVIGGPIIGRALQALDKKRKERQGQKELEASQHEALRTGRTTTRVSAGAPTQTARPTPRSAAERMQELARKRQLQLEELRRRQQAARQQASRGAPTTQRPAPTARSAPRPTARQTAGAPQSRATQPPARSPRRPATRLAPPQTPRFTAPTPTPTKHVSLRSTLHADGSHDLPINKHIRTVAPVQLMGKTMTAADWRRFIIARELLNPPLALRNPGEGRLL